MKNIRNLFVLLFSLLLFSCDKTEDLGESNIFINEERNEIDQWIYDNITKEFNVEVKYKWDATELELDKTLTAPEMSKVIPFLEVLKEVWIDTYKEEGGADFIKRMIPKQIVLVGSKNFNSDGTITQGTAEGGRKVVLYQINEFEKSDKRFLKRLFHVMHHEFGHILHQEVLYPEEFKLLTPGGYTAAWENVSLEDALNEGFISPYSKNIIDDDWVEIIAHMLTNSKADYDAIVAKASEAGQVILKQKETYVAAYFQDVWNIDIYKLQKRISDIIESY